MAKLNTADNYACFVEFLLGIVSAHVKDNLIEKIRMEYKGEFAE